MTVRIQDTETREEREQEKEEILDTKNMIEDTGEILAMEKELEEILAMEKEI